VLLKRIKTGGMKTTGWCFLAMMIVSSCRQTCKEKMAKLYSAQRNGLSEQKEVNKFSLQLAYVPSSILMKSGNEATERDTAFYYFKLNVVCPENNAQMAGDKTALYYGLDSLFATSEAQPRLNPVLVEPVVTGSHKSFDYLLVFAKKDFTPGKQVKVIFFDRLFTNTKQEFVFDRIKIDEIETLQCYANEG
jgi:hypothetical protein